MYRLIESKLCVVHIVIGLRSPLQRAITHAHFGMFCEISHKTEVL